MRLLRPPHLAAVRDRCQSPDLAPAYQSLRRQIEEFLALSMDPPDERAGFYHDYFCPQHAVELVFDPACPREHRCPEDGQGFAGEPYDAAWRWFVNNRLSTMAFKLALGWQIDGDAACRGRVEDILLGYARRYAGYEPNPDRAFAQGKATYQSLDEAVWLIPLVRAYDLVREDLSPAAQVRVEDDLLRPAAAHILGQKYWQIHNIECWHNAAIAAVGICLEDEDLSRPVQEGEFGFFHQLEAGVREDGLWWEGSTSYHFYALAALMTHAQMAEGVDESLRDAPRLQAMFRAPVDLAGPDLTLPATNDCWFFTSLLGEVCHGVPPAAEFYEVAYGWYGDPVFAGVLQHNYAGHPRTGLEALLCGRELPADTGGGMPVGGTHLAGSGLALLRSLGPPAEQNYLMLKYGPHGGGHGHPDKLSLSLYACGFPIAPDLGTPGYGIGLNESWYRQTLSHNTAVVDGCSQPAAEGQLLAFDGGEKAAFGVVDARVSWDEAPYEGVSMRRTILWTEAYFIDLFRVECDRERQIDWGFRFHGELEVARGLSAGEEVELQGEGYGHISAPIASTPEGPVRFQWALPTGRMALFLPQEEDTRIIQGQVPFNPATEQSDILIRRRWSRRAVFVALVHSWVREQGVVEVFPFPGDLPEEVAALWVCTAAEKHLWIICPRGREGTFDLPASGADRVLRYGL